MKRIQNKRFALINSQGEIWEGRMTSKISTLYELYGSRSAASVAGFEAKPVTVYFNLREQ